MNMETQRQTGNWGRKGLRQKVGQTTMLVRSLCLLGDDRLGREDSGQSAWRVEPMQKPYASRSKWFDREWCYYLNGYTCCLPFKKSFFKENLLDRLHFVAIFWKILVWAQSHDEKDVQNRDLRAGNYKNGLSFEICREYILYNQKWSSKENGQSSYERLHKNDAQMYYQIDRRNVLYWESYSRRCCNYAQESAKSLSSHSQKRILSRRPIGVLEISF